MTWPAYGVVTMTDTHVRPTVDALEARAVARRLNDSGEVAAPVRAFEADEWYVYASNLTIEEWRELHARLQRHSA